MKRTTAKLRELLAKGELIVAPGGYDALTAKIIDGMGFDAFYLSGFSTALSFGFPDVGFQDLTEMTTTIRKIANAISIPIIADADTGFGNAIHVTRAVKEYINAGAAAMHIEDQTFYKRCGHLAGKMLISQEEAAGKFKAACETRDKVDPDFVIIARCDARGAVGGGVEEAVKRAKAYEAAGADVIFIEAPASEEEVKYFVKSIHAPLLYNIAGISPRLSLKRLQELGIAIAIYPLLGLNSATRAVWDHAQAFKQEGTKAVVDIEQAMKGHPTGDLHKFIGTEDIVRLEEKFLPKSECEQRTNESKTGFRYYKNDNSAHKS